MCGVPSKLRGFGNESWYWPDASMKEACCQLTKINYIVQEKVDILATFKLNL